MIQKPSINMDDSEMMVENHINAIEKVLPAQSLGARNAGHPNLRGKETFERMPDRWLEKRTGI